MAQVTGDQLTESPTSMSPADPQSGQIHIDGPPRLKGKRRFFKSLQRISSSPSLAKFGRNITPSSSTYRLSGRGSISCISLSPAGQSSHGHSTSDSYSSQASAEFSTAPTSVAGTPKIGSQGSSHDRAGVRIIDSETSKKLLNAPTTAPLPSDFEFLSRSPTLDEAVEDYFTKLEHEAELEERRKRLIPAFNFWQDSPHEIRLQIFRFLRHQELVRCSIVSRAWYAMCYDGQLWQDLDAAEFYMRISPGQLTRIIQKAGPFIKTLGLRGCAQLEQQWPLGLAGTCSNLEGVNLQGSLIPRQPLRSLINRNRSLVHVDLMGVHGATNTTCRMLSELCPDLQYLDISFCANISERGLYKLADGCKKLRILKVGEVRGMNDRNLMLRFFENNSLEQLDCRLCDLTDECIKALFEGDDAQVDVLTNQAIVQPRKLRQINFSDCSALTDVAIRAMVGHIPELNDLQMSGCPLLTDSAFSEFFINTPLLSVLNLEGARLLGNTTVQALARSSCASQIIWLTISDCEQVSDAGMVALFKTAPRLQTVLMDNTKVGDLTLAEAVSSVRGRCYTNIPVGMPPFRALKLEVFDCQHVTWTGIREVLSRNAEIRGPAAPHKTAHPSCYPKGIVSLHCFYGWQQTVDEHEKRVLRGDFAAASRLERRWAQYMMASEEANIQGFGARRRRRRMREAAMLHDEEEGGAGLAVGRRRRARSGGCVVM